MRLGIAAVLLTVSAVGGPAVAQDPIILKGHAGWVDSVAFSPDGKTLASGSQDATAKL